MIKDKQGVDGIQEIINSNYAAAQNVSVVQEALAEYIANGDIDKKAKMSTKSLSKHSKVIRDENQLEDIIDDLKAMKPELKNGPIQIDW